LLPFWYLLTRVVPDKFQKSSKTIVCVCVCGPEETDIQHTTARFYILPMTSDVDELNLPDIISQFMEKIDGFSGQNSGWIISQINYLWLCWGCYRPLIAGTPK